MWCLFLSFLFSCAKDNILYTIFSLKKIFFCLKIMETTQCQFKNMTFFFMASVQFSHSVVSESLQPHELQHARPPCPSPWLNTINCVSISQFVLLFSQISILIVSHFAITNSITLNDVQLPCKNISSVYISGSKVALSCELHKCCSVFCFVLFFPFLSFPLWNQRLR